MDHQGTELGGWGAYVNLENVAPVPSTRGFWFSYNTKAWVRKEQEGTVQEAVLGRARSALAKSKAPGGQGSDPGRLAELRRCGQH